jgi:hypothetical protein
MTPHHAQIAIVIGGALAFGAPLAAQAQKAASTSTEVTRSPGKVTATERTSGSVVIASINKATRDILLKDASGKMIEIQAAPEVRNFDQLKVGDKVHAEYAQALSLELKKAGTAKTPASLKQLEAKAPKGASPGAAAGQVLTVTADVVAVDPAKQTVSVRGPRGQTVDLQVRDPAQFSNVKVGDHVVATYTEALAVVVEPVRY